MRTRALAPLLALFFAAIVAGVASAGLGDRVPGSDFSIGAPLGTAMGIAWTGSRFAVATTDSSYGAFTSSEGMALYSPDGSPVEDSDFIIAGSQHDEVAGVAYDGTNYYFALETTANPDKILVYNSTGTQINSFTLNTLIPSAGGGLAWEGTHLWVLHTDHIEAYTASGLRQPALRITLDSDNIGGSGLAWDGTYFRVVDRHDLKVYTYHRTDGHQSGDDFALGTGNDNPDGLTWDGANFFVGDITDDKVYVYEGPPTSFVNSGIPDDVEYGAALELPVEISGDWKCASSALASNVRVNNATLNVHGVCASNTGSSGLSVEIHLQSGQDYIDLDQLAAVTGRWIFGEAGTPAANERWIMDDAYNATGSLAFTEDGGLVESTRLGFSTLAITASDSDCSEDGGDGFACSRTYLSELLATDSALLVFGLSEENSIMSADTPVAPDSVRVARNATHTEAEISWALYDAVAEYEIERVTAVRVDVADASRIEYGDPVIYTIAGTQQGIDTHRDVSVEAHRTYQYRLRARGARAVSWSPWSAYVFSGAEPGVDLPAPSSLELSRDSNAVTASWRAPAGDLDGYSLQRQEIILVSGSTFFANVRSLAPDGSDWIPETSTMYVDSAIASGQTYEYRVAAVLDDQVGVYTDWFRIGPVTTSLGAAPNNLRRLETGERVFDTRYEYWLAWDDVGTADDYQVQVVTYNLAETGRSMADHVVTDPTFFRTAYSREALRVRGRQLDAEECAAADDNRCVTEWTPWYVASFVPDVPLPDLTMATPDTTSLEIRAAMDEVIDASLEPAGTIVDATQVMEFIVLVIALSLGSASLVLGWRRGMAPLGVGMGAAAMVLVLTAGYRVFGTAAAWPIAAQAMISMTGAISITRQIRALSGHPLMVMLVALIALHLSFGFSQFALSYYAGDVAQYGAAGFLSHTPIGSFISIESVDRTVGTNLSAIRQMFEVVDQTGDAINGLASFGYGFLTAIEPEDGLVYILVMIVRVVSWLFTVGLGISLLYVLFDSNLLTSKFGLALVGGGAALAGLLAGAGALIQ